MKHATASIFAFLALAAAAFTAAAAEPVAVASPDGRLVANFRLDAAGMPGYSVAWQGKPVVTDSALRLKIAEWPWQGAFEVANVTRHQQDETWRPVCGERRELRDRYNEVTLELREAQPPHRRLLLTFRAYDEGIAFQYTVPKQTGLDKITVTREASEFRFTADHAAWATYTAQGKYQRVALSAIRPGCERPLTIQAADDLFVALGEAKLADYARMKFAALPAPAAGVVSHLDGPVAATLPLITPWRVVMVAATPGRLLENNGIFLNLNDPCAIADTSWIKPGKVLRDVTLTTTGAKACIDFAAKRNLQYILFDAGWYGAEFSPKSDARAVNIDPDRSKGPLDLPEVIRYGAERGVGVLLYVNYVAMAKQLDEILPLYRSWGVKGVKYGFVKVGPQDVTAFMTRAIRLAAENRLMVDIHDELRPTGLSRTYPNLMTVEGILGDEAPERTNDQSLTALFSRFLAGPADNTICYYDSRVNHLNSHAYQLAKAVCFFSPLQHLYWYDRPAGSPLNVGKAGKEKPVIGDEPELVFFDRLPTVWDETRVVHGKIGEYAVIARRSGDNWFVGCMNNATARTLELPLSFLEAGRNYRAAIYSEDPAVQTRTRVKIERRTVDAATVLRVELPANGGQALELVPEAESIYRDGWIDFNKNGKCDAYEDPKQPLEKRVEDLLAQMTVEERTCQLATLYGYGRVLKDPLPTPGWKKEIWKDGIANIDEMHNGVGKYDTPAKNPHIASPAATVRALQQVQRWFIEETRLGIPVEFTNEGIRGLNYYRSTNFPANIALGATWNRSLSTQIGGVVGREGKALGYANIYAPIMDLCRDPRWGRVVECYGEDPYLVAEMGIAMAAAIQAQGVAASAKHFAVYSEPKGGRDGQARTDPHVAPREMEKFHLDPWERLVRETGLLGVMSSYNDYDGVPISGSREFMVERLRKQWGFRGYVVSDSWAVEFLHDKHRVAATPADGAAMFLREGGNVRTTFTPPQDFILPVREQIAQGKLAMSVIDDRVRDVLRVKFLEGLFDRPYAAEPEKAAAAIRTPAAAALALETARQSLVLLKNDKNTLPLAKNLKRLLVTGPCAKMKETSWDRYGSSGGEIVTLLDGIKAAVPGTEVIFRPGAAVTDAHWPESELYPEAPAGKDAAMIAEAVAAAKDVDAVILALGDSNDTIGESKSRTSLDLPGFQTDLAKALAATGKPVVVVLMTGRPATINWINRHIPAILCAWFPGEAGGTAVAEALFGDVNPGGRLPMTFPRTVGQLPFNFPYKPASHASQSKKNDPNGFGNSMAEGALYPFGFGLSYTTFKYADLSVTPKQIPSTGSVTVSVTVKNSGARAGDEVVQLYFRDDVSSVTTYDYNLCGFERIRLAPGESKAVIFTIPAKALELIDRSGKRVVEPGTFSVYVGASSADLRATGTFTVTE